MFNFTGNQTVFQSAMLLYFAFLPATYESSISQHLGTDYGIITIFKILAILIDVLMVFHCRLKSVCFG